jgi:tetratricopeptide (TPR) repeat protein
MKAVLVLLLACCAAFAATTPSKFEDLAKQADTARAASHSAEAITLYREALKLKPAWKEGWWYLGALLYDNEQYEDAREAMRRFVGLDPDGGPAWGLMGLCEYGVREYDLALAHIEKAVALGLRNAAQIEESVRFHEALLLTRSGQFEKALQIYIVFSRKADATPSLIEAVGLAALRMPMLPQEYPPQDRELVLTAGRASFEAMARRPQTAEAAFHDMMLRYSDRPNVHYLYGTYLLSSNPEEALNQLRAELEVAPQNVPCLVNLALEYLRRGDAASGVPYAQKAVQYAPGSFPGHNALGRLLVETGDVKGGIEQLEIATKLDPGSPQNHIALAGAYAKAGRQADAKRERQAFLDLRRELDAAEKH